MRILLADDQPQVCSALRLLLEQGRHTCIVGEAENAQELLDRCPTRLPDAILLDWELPGLSSAGGIASLRQAYPTSQIIALSSRPEARQSALQAGADQFVCKGDPPEKLLAALDHESTKRRLE
jgi:DNA-binding NarL/FixJ family response regulator